MNDTTAQGSTQAPGLDFGEKAVVLLGGVLAAMAMTAITVVLPLMQKNLAHTDTDTMLVKQMIGGVSLAMMIGAPLGGYLADRLGTRPMLLASTLLYGLAGTAGLWLSDLWLLLISRLLLGLGTACIQVVGMALINTRLAGNDRAKWMGLYVSIATLSTLVINPVAGALGEIGWRWPFALYAIALALFLILLPGGSNAERAESQAAARPAVSGLLSNFPWHYLPLSLLIGALTYVPAIYGPFLLREEAGLGPGGIAAVLTGMAAIGATTAILYGRARRSISVHTAFAASFVLCGVGTMIAGLAGTLEGIVLGMALHAIGTAWLVPNIMTSLGSKVDNTLQARAAGLVKSAHFLAAPVFVVLVEPVAREYGAASAMLVAAACALVMLVAIGARSLTGPKSPVTSPS